MQLKLSPNMMFTFKNEIPIVLKTNAFIREISQFEGNSLDQNLIYFVLATLIMMVKKLCSHKNHRRSLVEVARNQSVPVIRMKKSVRAN